MCDAAIECVVFNVAHVYLGGQISEYVESYDVCNSVIIKSPVTVSNDCSELFGLLTGISSVK